MHTAKCPMSPFVMHNPNRPWSCRFSPFIFGKIIRWQTAMRCHASYSIINSSHNSEWDVRACAWYDGGWRIWNCVIDALSLQFNCIKQLIAITAVIHDYIMRSTCAELSMRIVCRYPSLSLRHRCCRQFCFCCSAQTTRAHTAYGACVCLCLRSTGGRNFLMYIAISYMFCSRLDSNHRIHMQAIPFKIHKRQREWVKMPKGHSVSVCVLWWFNEISRSSRESRSYWFGANVHSNRFILVCICDDVVTMTSEPMRTVANPMTYHLCDVR